MCYLTKVDTHRLTQVIDKQIILLTYIVHVRSMVKLMSMMFGKAIFGNVMALLHLVELK